MSAEVICISSDEGEPEEESLAARRETKLEPNESMELAQKRKESSPLEGPQAKRAKLTASTERPTERVAKTTVSSEKPKEKVVKTTVSPEKPKEKAARPKSIVSPEKIKEGAVKSTASPEKAKEKSAKTKSTASPEKIKERVAKSTASPEKAKEKVARPTLIVREKRSVSPVDHHPFPLFVSLCLQRERTDDMQNIVRKLERSFARLDGAYKGSAEFKRFLNEKRDAMTSDKRSKFVYILEVVNEMKARIRGSSTLLCAAGRSEGEQEEEEEESEEAQRRRSKIARIDKAMQQCEKHIRKLEASEVDFDEEDDSTYIKLERYKRRMVELHVARCRMTGESSDAGRSYLRPRRLKPTGIAVIDDAITKFVNTKICKRNKLKNVGSAVDAFVFPNYSDILGCIRQCNQGQSLGFGASQLENIAETAFTQLGEHLQRVRRKDYWDTFSLYLEKQEEDPASRDEALAAKLAESQREGQKRLANVLQKYVDEQEKQSSKEVEAEESEEDDDSEEEDVEEEEEEEEEETGSESDGGRKQEEASPARVSGESPVRPVARLEDRPSAADRGEEEGSASVAGPAEEKPTLRLRSFAKPPTTWNDEKSPEYLRAQADLVDLTQASPTKKPAAARHCPKTIRLVRSVNNNHHELNGKRLKVIKADRVTVLRPNSLRMAKSIGAQVIKVITNINSQGQCARRRIQPQSIAVLHPTSPAARKK